MSTLHLIEEFKEDPKGQNLFEQGKKNHIPGSPEKTFTDLEESPSPTLLSANHTLLYINERRDMAPLVGKMMKTNLNIKKNLSKPAKQITKNDSLCIREESKEEQDT